MHVVGFFKYYTVSLNINKYYDQWSDFLKEITMALMELKPWSNTQFVYI